jgi:hypothetical protein
VELLELVDDPARLEVADDRVAGPEVTGVGESAPVRGSTRPMPAATSDPRWLPDAGEIVVSSTHAAAAGLVTTRTVRPASFSRSPLPTAKALHHRQERDSLGSMATANPGDKSESLGLRQRTLLVFLADGLVRSAVDVEGEEIGFTEGQARATIRSLEKRKLLEARGFTGGSVRRSFGLTDAGRDVAAGLMIDRWLDNNPEPF